MDIIHTRPIYIYIYKKNKIKTLTLSLSLTHTLSLTWASILTVTLSLFLSPKPPWPSTLNSSLWSLAPPLQWSSPSPNKPSQPRGDWTMHHRSKPVIADLDFGDADKTVRGPTANLTICGFHTFCSLSISFFVFGCWEKLEGKEKFWSLGAFVQPWCPFLFVGLISWMGSSKTLPIVI